MKKYIAALMGIAAALGLAACGGGGASTSNAAAASNAVQNNEVSAIADQLLKLEKAEPPASPSDSSNLKIQNAWYTAEADPSKIWYGELLSSSGTLEVAYVTQGPAVAASDQVTNPLQAVWQYDDQGCNCSGAVAGVGIGLAEPDGTYDATSPELLAISATGAIFRIWVGSGQYLQSDQPFRTTQTPILTENTSVAPSKTDTSGTANAYVPTTAP